MSTDQTEAVGQQTPTVAAVDTSTAESRPDESAPLEMTVGKVPVDMLRALATNPDYEAREFVARHPSTPVEVLASLAADPEKSVRCAVAENPSTPEEVKCALATDSADHVRYTLACNASTSPEVLRTLAADSEDWVRCWAAENPSTPENVLRKLAADPSSALRASAARNPSTPIDVLSTLTNDPQVRDIVVCNLSLPPEILRTLTADPDPLVRLRVACNPSMPVDVLRKLATGTEEEVRSSVAANRSTPGDVLRILSADPDQHVRERAAGNPYAPTDVLTTLAADPDERVRERAAENPSTPADALTTLAADPDKSQVASNPSAPAQMLRALASDPDYEVRYAVAGNPSTPFDALPFVTRSGRESVLDDPRIASGLGYARDMIQAGYYTPKDVVDFCWANDSEFGSDSPSLMALCWQAVEELWNEASQEWNSSRTSDADRLDTMLRILRARNVIVAENEEDCSTCIGGWANNAMKSRAAAGLAPVGWVGFHSQDTESGVGPGLLFFFGAYFPTEVDDEVAAAADTQVARLLQDAAETVGLDTKWDGDTSKRLSVLVPDWRKRLDPFDRQAVRVGIEYPSNLVDVLYVLSQDVDPRVRSAVAQNPNAPAAILHQLAADTSQTVRCQVAANPSTYEALQRWLAESDPDGEVRTIAGAALV